MLKLMKSSSTMHVCKDNKNYLKGLFLLLPSILHESLGKVKKAIQTTNSDYNIVIKRLHLYYDMKLVTFGIDKE